MSQASPGPPDDGAINRTFTRRQEIATHKRQAHKVSRLRSALLQAVSGADLRCVVNRLADAAKKGNVSAAKLLLDRLLGPALPLDIEQRLAALEERKVDP
jgi:hypothetical protein